MRFRNDKVDKPRAEQWSQLELNERVERGFLDRATLFRVGKRVWRSKNRQEPVCGSFSRSGC